MTKSRRITLLKYLLCGVLLVRYFPGVAFAQDNNDEAQERATLTKMIKDIKANPTEYKAALSAGKDRSLLCSNCHGADGNSKRKDIPNLAGQNPAYIIQQIEKFKDGRRKNFVMQTLANDFTLKDKANLAVFFNSKTVKPHSFDPIKAGIGRDIFLSRCQYCHGHDGQGEAGYARLAGQKQQYVINTLKRFRANAHDTRAQRAESKRTNIRMEQVTQNLTDDDINNLAEFIASIQLGGKS